MIRNRLVHTGITSAGNGWRSGCRDDNGGVKIEQCLGMNEWAAAVSVCEWTEIWKSENLGRWCSVLDITHLTRKTHLISAVVSYLVLHVITDQLCGCQRQEQHTPIVWSAFSCRLHGYTYHFREPLRCPCRNSFPRNTLRLAVSNQSQLKPPPPRSLPSPPPPPTPYE